MSDREHLEQQLWELIYGLLDEKEQTALLKRVTSEPDVARAYAEAKLRADLVADAAKVQQPAISFVRPETPAAPEQDAAPQHAELGLAKKFSQRRRIANWLASLAALLMLGLFGYCWLAPSSPVNSSTVAYRQQRVEAEHRINRLRLEVIRPAQLASETDNFISVRTANPAGEPVSSSVQLEYFGDGDAALERQHARTGADGVAQFSISGEKVVDDGRLKVTARRQEESADVTVAVEREPVEFDTYVTVDKPVYSPGETVQFRSLTLSRFGFEPPDRLQLNYTIYDSQGAPLPGASWNVDTTRGVGWGRFTTAPDALGDYSLEVARIDGEVLARNEFQVGRRQRERYVKDLELAKSSYAPGETVVADFLATPLARATARPATVEVEAIVDGTSVAVESPVARTDERGGAKIRFDLPSEIERGEATLAVTLDDGAVRETISRPIPVQLKQTQVDFYPVGGDLAGGLPATVYFHAHDPQGRPVSLSGRIVDEQGEEAASVSTRQQGRGVFAFTPPAGRQYTLQIDDPPGLSDQPLPVASDRSWLSMMANPQVGSPPAPLTVSVWSQQADVPLVIVAHCRGVSVGQAVATTSGDPRQAQQVVVPLASNASGVIRVTVFDDRTDPPKAIAEQLVYRRMREKLLVEMAGQSHWYAPNDTAKLNFLLTNESRQAVAGALGVSVTDQAALTLGEKSPPDIDTFFLLASSVETPEDIEDINFYLEDSPRATEALQLLLGTQGWRRFIDASGPAASEPVRLAAKSVEIRPVDPIEAPLQHDNDQQLQDRLRASMLAFHQRRAGWMQALGQAMFAAAALALLSLAMMAIFQVRPGRSATALAGAMSIAGLLFGLILLTATIDERGNLAYFQLTADAPVELAQAPDQGEAEDASESTEALKEQAANAWHYDEAPRAMDDAEAGAAAPAEPPSAEPAPAEGEMDALGVAPMEMEEESQSDQRSRQLAKKSKQASPPAAAQSKQASPPAAAQTKQMQAASESDGVEGASPAPMPEAAPAEGQETSEHFSPTRPAPPEEPAAESSFNWGDAASPQGGFGGGTSSLGVEAKSPSTPRQTTMAPPTVERRAGRSRTPSPPSPTSPSTKADKNNGPAAIQFERGLPSTPAQPPAADQPATARAARPTPPANRLGEQEERTVGADRLAQVRLYALPPRNPSGAYSRSSDAKETVYFNPLLLTDEDGRASVQAPLSDSITRYRVSVDAHGQRRIGVGRETIQTRLPLRVEAPSRLFAVQGDRLEVPVGVHNDTSQQVELVASVESSDSVSGKRLESLRRQRFARSNVDRKSLSLSAEADDARQPGSYFTDNSPLSLLGATNRRVAAPAQSSRREHFAFEAVDQGAAKLRFSVSNGDFGDSMETAVKVAPSGYPDQRTYAGEIESGAPVAFVLPESWADRRVQMELTLYPNILSQVQHASQSLRRGKAGDEQAVFAVDSLLAEALAERSLADPALLRRLKQTSSSLAQQQGEPAGNAGMEAMFLYDFGAVAGGAAPASNRSEANAAIANESIAKYLQQDRTLDFRITSQGKTSGDSAVLGLAAIAAQQQDHPAGGKLAESLAAWQNERGQVEGAKAATPMEATSLAALAWARTPQLQDRAGNAVNWLLQQRDADGAFGDARSTALALRALWQTRELRSSYPGDGEVSVRYAGRELAQATISSAARLPTTVQTPLQASSTSDSKLSLSFDGEGSLPYVLSARCHSPEPPPSGEAPLEIATSLSHESASLNQLVILTVALTNTSEDPLIGVAAEVGIPGGLEVDVKSLSELKRSGVISGYSLGRGSLSLHFRRLEPREIMCRVLLVAQTPGRFSSVPSSVRLTTEDDERSWAPPLTVTIER